MESDEMPLTDYQALAELRYRIRRFLHFSEQAARAAGLEPQHHQLLLAVKGLPDPCALRAFALPLRNAFAVAAPAPRLPGTVAFMP